MTHWASQGDAPHFDQWAMGPISCNFDNSITSPHRRQLCLRWMLKCPQEGETPMEPPTVLHRPGDPGPRPGPFLPHSTPRSLQTRACWEVQQPPASSSFLPVPNEGPGEEKSLKARGRWSCRRVEASGPSETP